MKKTACLMASLWLVGWALGAQAQTVWTYEVIGADNVARITPRPPMDISYPAAHEGVPDRSGKPLETVLTREEAAARLRAPMLIIMLNPGVRPQ